MTLNPAMTDLTTLRDRVAAATGAGRELDALIALACHYQHDPQMDWVLKFPEWRIHPRYPQAVQVVGAADQGGGAYWYPSPLTSSIDAAVALIERKLPGRSAELIRVALRALSERFAWHTAGQETEHMKLFPLALLLAGLNALIAQENDHA